MLLYFLIHTACLNDSASCVILYFTSDFSISLAVIYKVPCTNCGRVYTGETENHSEEEW